jgi:hypothetical protein
VGVLADRGGELVNHLRGDPAQEVITMPRGPASATTSIMMDSCCGASVVYEAGKRRSRVSGSKKLQVRELRLAKPA